MIPKGARKWLCRRALPAALLATAAAAAGRPVDAQGPACSKVFLLPLQARAVQVEADDRAFFNIFHLCGESAVSADGLRDAGIDLDTVYEFLHLSENEPSSFDGLGRWAGEHCAEYGGAAPEERLERIVQQIARSPEASREIQVYQDCLQATGLWCHAWAEPANERLVGLLIHWRPMAGRAAGPSILNASVSGAVEPAQVFEAEAAAAPPGPPAMIRSLVQKKVAEAGILRVFLRPSPETEVTFQIAADHGSCQVDKVAAAGPARQIYSVVGVDVPAKRAGSPAADEIRARLHGEIWIEVRNLRHWLQRLKDEERLGKEEDIRDLVPYFDGIALSGVHPTNPEALPRLEDGDEIHRLHFDLERNQGNKTAWSHLLNEPSFEQRIAASVGFEGGREMPTTVVPEAAAKNEMLYLVIIPAGRALTGFGLIGGSLLLFFALAAKTDIIRDTHLPLRPDGCHPFSLARSQMAFWFYLVSASYFLLWLITGDTDTITSSVLSLIGISAGTALGATIVDSGKSGDVELHRHVADVSLSAGRPQIRAALKEQLLAARRELAALQEGGNAVDAAAVCQARILLLESQRDFFSRPVWKIFLADLLGENGVISFHSFQIVVWTLVLGIIFVVKVYHELAMPEFSATLLGLMGVSAGTYVGFKLPEKKAVANEASS
jgi:hypothetical protein